ncbi:hypothetical protein PPL_06986 [Heterostelium album PN500]|uniref:Uncharacterized protein n=1 Tax=Heterostelium pallidum (strain ATCC 26659 / Pp 5 / PN500) TaxID=670386 RepID=D3BE33_HETP5|nr:hypothetical protein PPL_06986 [Heterostelium album PN500]EFA80164.1 hypothetical protein PPL_06986 [Heterostelium album PN500]|eukprot:XP_020432284.1 hypothetical protein PPL_06986 [Heterostelium album PN500]
MSGLYRYISRSTTFSSLNLKCSITQLSLPFKYSSINNSNVGVNNNNIVNTSSLFNNRYSNNIGTFNNNNNNNNNNSFNNTYCTKSDFNNIRVKNNKDGSVSIDELFHKEQNRFWRKIKDRVEEPLWKAIQDTDWVKPTDIQTAIIPHILDNRNVLASSKTGNGKTAAYSIPLLHIVNTVKQNIINNNINKEDNNQQQKEDKEVDAEEEEEENGQAEVVIQTTTTKLKIPIINTKELNRFDPIGLVIVPSKELAIQVTEHIEQLSKYMDGIRIVNIFGGVGEFTQEKKIKSGVDILVGTTGAILQQLSKGNLSLRQVHMTVLDEFDKLFNYGFFPDVKQIFDSMPLIAHKNRNGMQTALFSATINFEKHNDLITRFSPYHIMENFNKDLQPPKEVRQHFYLIDHRKKRSLLLYFFRRGGKTSLKNSKVLIFARTQQRVDNLVKSLGEEGIKALPIHADMSLAKRVETVQQFKDGNEFQVIVATDVMARGIDIEDLDAVVNFDVPHVSEDYVHRVGRVGRQGKEGFSLSFVSKEKLVFEVGQRVVGLNEQHLIKNIEKLLSKQINYSKIPGPWKEDDVADGSEEEEGHVDGESEPLVDKVDDEKRHQDRLERKSVLQILLKRNMLEKIDGPMTRQGLPRVRINPNAKISNRMLAKLKIDRKGEIVELPPLTDFGDGRYEEVVSQFDKQSARSKGVGIRPANKKVFAPSKIMTKRQEKKNIKDSIFNSKFNNTNDNSDLDHQ